MAQIQAFLDFKKKLEEEKNRRLRRGQNQAEGATFQQADEFARREGAIEEEIQRQGGASLIDALTTGGGGLAGAAAGAQFGGSLGSFLGPIGAGVGATGGAIGGGLLGAFGGSGLGDVLQGDPLGTTGSDVLQSLGGVVQGATDVAGQRVIQREGLVTPQVAAAQQRASFAASQAQPEVLRQASEFLAGKNQPSQAQVDSLQRIRGNQRHVQDTLSDQNTNTAAINALLQQAGELRGVRNSILQNILPQVQRNAEIGRQQQIDAAKQAQQDSLGAALGSVLGGALGGNIGGGLQQAGALLEQSQAAGAAGGQQQFKQTLDTLRLLGDFTTRRGNLLGKVATATGLAPGQRIRAERDFLKLQVEQIEAERRGFTAGVDTVQLGERTFKAIPAIGVSTAGIGLGDKPGSQQLFINRDALNVQGQVPAVLRKDLAAKSGFMNQTKVLMDEMLQIYEQVGPQFDPALSPQVSITDPLTGEQRDVNAGARLGQIHAILTGESRIKFGGPLDEGMERVIANIVQNPNDIKSALKALGTNELEAIKTQVSEFGRQAGREFDIFKQSNGIKSELDVYLESSGVQILPTPTAEGKKYFLPTGEGDNGILMNDATLIKLMRLQRN